MAYFRDLREFVSFLDQRGQALALHEANRQGHGAHPVPSPAAPWSRPRQRGGRFCSSGPSTAAAREYSPVLAGIYGVSTDIHMLGLGCDTLTELRERWHQAVTHPIDPVIVADGPVHEEIHTGDELKQLGLEALPAPLEDPGYSGMIRTGTPMVTRDPPPESATSAPSTRFFHARDRMVAGNRPLSPVSPAFPGLPQARREVPRRDRGRIDPQLDGNRLGRGPTGHGRVRVSGRAGGRADGARPLQDHRSRSARHRRDRDRGVVRPGCHGNRGALRRVSGHS